MGEFGSFWGSKWRRAAVVIVHAIIATAGASLVACGNREDVGKQGSMVELPKFSVRVDLSVAAETLLRESGESVQVVAHLDGSGQALPGVNNEPFREVYFGMWLRTLDGAGVVQFDGLRVAESEWARLDDANFYVTINVCSAREAHKDNLLTGGTTVTQIDDIKDAELRVLCRLIMEDE